MKNDYISKLHFISKHLVTLLVLVLLGVGVGSVSGQITTLNAWSSTYHGTGNLSAAYTVSTGSNARRLLVIAVASSQTAIGNARTATVTYGGKTLTQGPGDMSTSTVRQHTQLYYLTEAGLDAASGTTLTVTFGGGTVRVNDVFAAVFDNIDQSAPIADSETYSSGTTNTSNPVFSTALNVDANNKAIEVISSLRSGSTTPRTITYATNWTIGNTGIEQTYKITDGVRNTVANRSVPTTNVTDASSTGFSGNALGSMTAMSLKYLPSNTQFKSVTSGNWNSLTTWQQSVDNLNWVAATTIPAANDFVTIQDGNTVTLTTLASVKNLNINGGLDVGTYALTGSGTMTIASTGVLLVGGPFNFPTGFPTTTLNVGSIVNYNSNGAQTVSNQAYSNLTLSGSGAKTLLPALSIINGNLTLSNTATTTTVAALTIGGNLNIGDGTTFNAAGYNLTVTGTTTVGDGASGTLTIGAYNGTKIFKGLLLVNSGGAWNNSGNSPVTFQGGITNNGTFTPGNGTQTFENTAQSLTGNLDMSGAATVFNTNVTNQGTLTLTANVSGSGSLINAASGTLNSSAYTTVTTLTNQGTLNASGNNNISSSTLTNTSTGILNLSGTAYTAPTTSFTNQGILTYTSSANINTPVTNTGTINVQSSGYIAGITNNAGGTVNIAALSYRINSLTASEAGNTVIYSGAGDQTIINTRYSYLILSGAGTKTFIAAATINNTFTNNGVIANLASGQSSANAYYLGEIQQAISSWGGSASTATNRDEAHFGTTSTGILNITNACISGTWTGATNTDWNTPSNWCDGHVPTESTNVYIPNVNNKPAIGTAGGLCKNITIETGSSLTQVDATIGASNLFVYGSWTNNGTYTCGIGTTTFAGASAQTIGGNNPTSFYNLTIQNTGGVTLNKATTVTRTLLLISGVINTTVPNLLSVTTALITNQDNTYTTAYGVIMGGSSISYINGPVRWSLPPNLAAGSIYKFPVGNTTYLPFTLENPITGGTAPTVQVQAYSTSSGGGKGSMAAISTTEYWKLTTITGNFTSTQVTLGKGNDQVYPYNVVAESQTQGDTYASLHGTPGFYDVSKSDITNHVNYYFTLGTINTPTINVSPIVLGGFGYIFNFGPSTEQTFTVNGTSLQDGIVIKAPKEYEISNTTGINFGQTITLTRDGNNNVISTTLYIRLKSGLAVGTYNGNSITITSTGATPKNIECNGTVFASTPSIITSGGLSCDDNEIDLFSSSSSPDINILYWTGPNNYYSQLEDPVIRPVTASMYGLYTVTGSIPTGANLIVNGDFSQGDTGFSSSYVYTTTASDHQGIYNVTDNPKSMNTVFSAQTLNNKQLVIDGATTANVTVWSETVKVVPNSTYQFTYLLKAIYDIDHPSIIQLFANNQAIGTPFTAVAPLGQYKKYYYNWYSGSSTSVTLDLRNQSTVAIGNDFAIDDIDFKTVTQVSSSVNVPGTHASAVSISSPTLNTATNTATVTTGTNVTYTATSTNGGQFPTYVWKVTNGTNVVSYPSTSSSTFNYVPVTGDVISCVMTPSKDNTCAGVEAISNPIIMSFTGASNYWIGAPGADGTDWWRPANWTANKVPAPGDNVEFATGGSTGNNGINGWAINDLYVDNNRIVGNLINNASGKNLVIPANTQLYVNNKITLTPVDPNASYDQILIKADPNLDPLNPIPNGSLIFHNSDKDNKVSGSVEMYTKSYFKTDPDVNKEFFWQYFGIPVESIKADPTFYGAYVRKANEAGDETDANYYWTELGNNDVLTAFDGYEICQPLDSKGLLFQGKLVNWDFSRTLIYSPGTNVKYPGQHLLANPYAAAINVTKINFGKDIDASVSLYTTGSYGQWSDGGNGVGDGTNPGQFTTIPQSPAGSNGLPLEVPSMSSMLVRVRSPRTDANSVISFNYKDVINKNTTIQKVKAVDALTNTDLISTRIDLTGQHYSDRMWIFTEPSCTKNFDNGWDGRKMLGSSLAPQIYAIEPDGDYQVNSISDMNNTDLAFQAGDEVEYTLKFTHENIQRQYAGVYLVDLIENKTVDVSETGSTYTFATTQSDAPAKRFKILTRPYEKGAPDKDAQVKIFTAPGRVFVQNLSTSKGECTLYDIAGRAIKNASFAANAVTEVINNLTRGAYVVNTITNGEKVSKRVIVQ